MDAGTLRIGELARLAGVSPRMIRHYHRAGVLPEPERAANGYRTYGVRDVVLLLRVRQLVELGLSLDEVRDALADSGGREMREILTGLDADLATQQRRITDRRRRLAGLVALIDGDGDGKKAVLDRLSGMADVAGAAMERERLAADLIEASADPHLLPDVWSTYHRLLDDETSSAELAEMSRRFDALAGLDPHDPAVDALATHAAALGDTVLALLPPDVRDGPGDPEAADRLLTVLRSGMDPAQARCLSLVFAGWKQASS